MRYNIGAEFCRFHCNPPIWSDYHHHTFRVSLELQTPMTATDLYGVDMVEAESLLQQLIDQIPERVNLHPELSNGTTEQLCQFFIRHWKYPDPLVYLLSVGVSETPTRETKMLANNFLK